MRVEQRAITEDDVGFMIAPRINAASRMGDAREAFRLFTTTSEDEANFLVKSLERANRQRKAEAGAITRAVHTRIKERGEVRSVIALGDPEWRPSLLGLVANVIADEYERPVFLWGREGNMSLKGSFRSGGFAQTMELMRATEKTFSQFGGHSAAGGFTVIDDAVFFLEDRLIEARARVASEKVVLDEFEQRADAVITPEDATGAFLKKIERLAPFGIGNQKPVFMMRDVVVGGISRFGKAKEHLKIKIHSQKDSAEEIDAVTFFVKGSLACAAEKLAGGNRVNLLAHIERDTFSRANPIRLRLLNIRT